MTGAEERSVTGLAYPIAINQLDRGALASLPGIGKKRAARLVMEKPLRDLGHLHTIAEGRIFQHLSGGEDDRFDFAARRETETSGAGSV